MVLHVLGAEYVRFVRVVLVLENPPIKHNPVVFALPVDVHHELLCGFERHLEGDVGLLESDVAAHGGGLYAEEVLGQRSTACRGLRFANGLGVSLRFRLLCGIIILRASLCLLGLQESLTVLFVEVNGVIGQKLLLDVFLCHTHYLVL